MNAAYEWWLSVASLVLGGGLIWKLRLFAAPGPSLSVTSRNTTRDNHEYPRLLEIENFGDKAAQGVAWEIRNYYIAWLPSYESRRGTRMAPLKPGENFLIDRGSKSASVALLSDFEIIMSYMGPNRAKFVSHFTIDGDVMRNDSGLNRARWIFTFPLVGVWVRQFFVNLRVRLTVRIRPILYRCCLWLAKENLMRMGLSRLS